MMTEALRLHDAGFWVIPNHWIKEDGICTCPKGRDCPSPGKHPLCSWKEAQTRRFTREELEIWWGTYPDANIGVLTGELPDLVCLDVDVKDGTDGRETIRQHAKEGKELPKTLTDARGDGLHLFFRYPKDTPAELRNIQDGKLGPGLDLRAGGGQVIIAPSMHFSGERRRIVDDTPPAELPGWIVDLALSDRQKDRGDQATPERIDRDNAEGTGLPDSERKRLIACYMRKRFPGRIVSGNRHHALQQIGGLMRAAGSEAQEIYDFLVDVNQTLCDPPKPDADQEIRDIAQFLMDKPVTMSAPGYILLTHRPLPEITKQGLAALKRSNNPPRLFVRGGRIVFVDRDEKGVPFLRALDEHGLKGELARAAEWKRASQKEGLVDSAPTLEIARDVFSRPVSEWCLPALEVVTQTPIIHRDGAILPPGYDPETRAYYLPEPGFELPDIPEAPTPEEIASAVRMVNEPFRDFPFSDECARSNAIGALITAVTRPIIDGPVPCFVVDKPQAGSGASLLQKAVYSLATGLEPEEKGAPSREEEWEKRLLAILRSGRPICIFDNVEGILQSENLARVLTSQMCGGRVLGKSEEVVYPNRATWMANGNNVQIGGDLARRIWLSRIDPQVAIPWQRTDFTHHDLLGWCKKHRGEVIGAILTLIRAWIQQGSPAPEKVPLFGGYDSWRNTVGGILESNGIMEFLANAEQVYLEGDADLREDETFLNALYEQFKSNTWAVKDLVDVLENAQVVPGKPNLSECLPDRLSRVFKKRDRDFNRAAGRALARYNGKRFPCGLMIEKSGQDATTKVILWRVIGWEENTKEQNQPDSNTGNPGDDDTSAGGGENTKEQNQPDSNTGNPGDDSVIPGVTGLPDIDCVQTRKKITTYTHTRDLLYGRAANKPRKPRNPGRLIPVRITQDLDLFVGSDGRTYDCRKDEIITLPEADAIALIERGAAVRLPSPSFVPSWQKE